MTPEIWETLTPQQQAQHCWNVLHEMIRSAMESNYRAGNDATLIVPGLTTIITRKL